MKYLYLIIFAFHSSISSAQNLPQCDSLVITCCAFDSLGANTITIHVANPTTELFDYPGFVLMDLNLDTIAKETVNYFGIGTWPQPHTMNILAPLNLPFDGYLDLYQLFYQQFSCRFPFSIEDTATGISSGMREPRVKIFPNPAISEVIVDLQESFPGQFTLLITDMLGSTLRKVQIENEQTFIELNGISAGIYFLKIIESEKSIYGMEKLVVVKSAL